jgi:hypothetical protein
MKFYNPFKWHKVRFHDGRYAARQLSLFYWGWRYKDFKNTEFSWSSNVYRDHCRVNDESVVDRFLSGVDPEFDRGTKV